MFGYVNVSIKELTPEQRTRYSSIYCGICCCIREQTCQTARLVLSYDMTFLAMLLMSLYEPEEVTNPNACILHPIKKRPWVDNPYIRYAADMNVLLAYYQCRDNYMDDHSRRAQLMGNKLQPYVADISQRYPRQHQAICRNLDLLSQLEQANSADLDAVAACFGDLLGELFVYEEDYWSSRLRETGSALGRFIYLADAAVDYAKDKKKHHYNPFLAMDTGADWPRWEEYLVLAMGRCAQYYEQLPLVQDKAILDNILYSGVWTNLGRLRKKAGEQT